MMGVMDLPGSPVPHAPAGPRPSSVMSRAPTPQEWVGRDGEVGSLVARAEHAERWASGAGSGSSGHSGSGSGRRQLWATPPSRGATARQGGAAAEQGGATAGQGVGMACPGDGSAVAGPGQRQGWSEVQQGQQQQPQQGWVPAAAPVAYGPPLPSQWLPGGGGLGVAGQGPWPAVAGGMQAQAQAGGPSVAGQAGAGGPPVASKWWVGGWVGGWVQGGTILHTSDCLPLPATACYCL